MDADNARLLCPEFSLKVTCGTFPEVHGVLPQSAFQRRLPPARGVLHLSVGKTVPEKTCPRSDVSHRRIRHYGIYHLLLAPRWNSTPRGPRGSSLCCPGSSPLTTTCPLAGLPPCLTPLLPQVLGFQSFSQALLWGKVFELTFIGETQNSNSEWSQNSYFFFHIRKEQNAVI